MVRVIVDSDVDCFDPAIPSQPRELQEHAENELCAFCDAATWNLNQRGAKHGPKVSLSFLNSCIILTVAFIFI
jgi:hypothetical protein